MYALYMMPRKMVTWLVVMLKDYLEREEAAVVLFTFADQERATRLTMEEERREGERKKAQEIAKRMEQAQERYLRELWRSHGRQGSRLHSQEDERPR